MKKHISRIWSVVLAAMLCLAVFQVSVSAAGIITADIQFSVTVSGEEGTLDSDIPSETYTFTLAALNDEPMPENDTITITGAGEGTFSIEYQQVGIYYYTLTQDSSSLSGDNSICNDRGNYDATVYYLEVYVLNAEDGGYEVVAVAYRDGASGEKCEDLVFENTYDPVPYTSITVNKTWTDNDQSRPNSIEVQLLDGDEVIETVTLKVGTGWTYTWTGLDPYGEHSWDVKEVAVDGYTAEYSTSEDGTIAIHNVGDKIVETETEEPETEEPEDPAVPETPDTTTSAQTGDTASIVLYILVMAAAAAVIIFLVFYSKRKKTE